MIAALQKDLKTLFVVHRQKVDDSLAGETPLDRILIAVGETETRTKAPTAMADGVPVSPIIRGKGVRIVYQREWKRLRVFAG